MSIAILFLKYGFSSEPSFFINIIKISKNSIYFWEFILVNIQYIGIFPEKIKCNSNHNTSITKTSTQQYHVTFTQIISIIFYLKLSEENDEKMFFLFCFLFQNVWFLTKMILVFYIHALKVILKLFWAPYEYE